MKTNQKLFAQSYWLAMLALLTAISFNIAFGQGKLTLGGNHWQKYWGWSTNAPPPLPLPDAYQLALTRVGVASNHFFCVSATTLDMTNYYFRGWAFTFSNTNGIRARVEISFDKEVRVDPVSEHIIDGK